MIYKVGNLCEFQIIMPIRAEIDLNLNAIMLLFLRHKFNFKLI
jgi:hypothetical protein